MRRILACNCTVCGLTKVFDFEVIFYVDRHSLVRISQVQRLASLSVRHICALINLVFEIIILIYIPTREAVYNKTSGQNRVNWGQCTQPRGSAASGVSGLPQS